MSIRDSRLYSTPAPLPNPLTAADIRDNLHIVSTEFRAKLSSFVAPAPSTGSTQHDRTQPGGMWNVIGLEMTLILILLAYIFGMLTAIKLTRS